MTTTSAKAKRLTKEERFEQQAEQRFLDAVPKRWAQAVEWENAVDAWRAANPPEAFDAFWQYMEAQAAFEKANRIPRWDKPGRLRPHQLGPHRWYYVKLPLSISGQKYAVLCRKCRALQVVWHPASGAGACHECRRQELAEQALIKAEKRKVRERARSVELANRKGLCLVCKSEMTVARCTKTTCSDRCRKQWIRKGPTSFPLPAIPETVLVGQEELPLQQALEKLVAQRHDRTSALIRAGQDWRNDPIRSALTDGIEEVEALQELHRMKSEEPAVFLYEWESCQ
jgi:hypothetical protein